MKTNQSKSRASRFRTLGPRFEKMLASLVNDLYLFGSVISARWMVKRELKRREAEQTKVGYEAEKRKLPFTLRRKSSDRRSKQ